MTRDHLLEGEDGAYICKVCTHQISIGSTGTEYGHQRYGGGRGGADGRCPHRPDACDPNHPGGLPASVAHEGGQFVAADGGDPR